MNIIYQNPVYIEFSSCQLLFLNSDLSSKILTSSQPGWRKKSSSRRRSCAASVWAVWRRWLVRGSGYAPKGSSILVGSWWGNLSWRALCLRAQGHRRRPSWSCVAALPSDSPMTRPWRRLEYLAQPLLDGFKPSGRSVWRRSGRTLSSRTRSLEVLARRWRWTKLR